MKKFALVGALATLAIGTTACGGGGGDDTLTEREYIRSLERLCTQVNDDIADLDVPEDISDYVRFGEDALEITSDSLTDLQELKPPKELQADHDDYVTSVENTIDLTDDFIAAAEDEDEDAVNDILDDLADENDERNAIAEDIGADDCIDDVVEDPGDDPANTTEPDEPADTTDPDGTVPRITVPPVDMTMPTDTEPPVVSGSEISTIDFNELNLPAGYSFENADPDALSNIQNLYAEQFSGAIEAIGGAAVADDTTGETFSAFVFFWTEDLGETGNGTAFVEDLATGTDVAEWSQVETSAGLFGDRLLYDDNTEALVVWGGQTAIVTFGDVGSQDSLANLMDALVG